MKGFEKIENTYALMSLLREAHDDLQSICDNIFELAFDNRFDNDCFAFAALGKVEAMMSTAELVEHDLCMALGIEDE